MSVRDALSIRNKLLEIARLGYVEPDTFPTSYAEACDPSVCLGDSLARFIAMEVWEAIEASDDAETAKSKVCEALSVAIGQLEVVRTCIARCAL